MSFKIELKFKTYNLKLILLIAVLVLLLFSIKPFIISGASMEPSYSDGNIVLVERISHRFGIERGDELLFHNPRGTGEVTLKRVIGLPTETVSIREDTVSILYSKEHGYHEETFGNGTVIGNGENGTAFNMYLGPEDYFVLGDNRVESTDSRVFGTVQAEHIIGKPILKLKF